MILNLKIACDKTEIYVLFIVCLGRKIIFATIVHHLLLNYHLKRARNIFIAEQQTIQNKIWLDNSELIIFRSANEKEKPLYQS